MFETIFRWLISNGVEDTTAVWIARYGSILLVILVTIIMFFVIRRALLNWATTLSQQSKTNWDDALLHNRVFYRVAGLLPFIVIYLLAPVALEGPLYVGWLAIINTALSVIFTIQIVLIIDGLLGALREISDQYEATHDLPVDSVVQLLKIALYFFGTLVAISYLIGQTPVYLLSGLGAVTAVLSFVYQDALRGLMAGIQLTGNKMLSKGDVIEMPSYSVSGTVLEVGLTTVKVQNFDYSITTVPTYALISDSFKNWRGMQDAGGRRIVRTIMLDVNSVKFCDDHLLDTLRQISLLNPLLEERKAEVDAYNTEQNIDKTLPVNGRHLTNLGLFRMYLTAYLKHHTLINQDMTLMVRQLEPSTTGIGLQIYAFCADKTWATYEGVMADIFDHIIASTATFDLNVYQAPAGHDIQAINKTKAHD